MKKIILASALALGSAYGGAALAKSSQAPFTLSSSDFKPGQSVAHKHVFNGFGCTGENLSPALSWKNAPKGTKSFTLTVYDPDAPTGSGWWHWVVYNIPANATSLPASIGQGANLPAGAIQGLNDFSTNHYGGPCPPKGAQAHRHAQRSVGRKIRFTDKCLTRIGWLYEQCQQFGQSHVNREIWPLIIA